MFGRSDSMVDEGRSPGGAGLAWLAVAWIAGIVLAAQWSNRWGYVGAAAVALVCAAVLLVRRKMRLAYGLALVSFALVGGAWFVVQRDYVAGDDISRVVQDERVIAGVRGTVLSLPREVEAGRGAFGAFSYFTPGTHFELAVDSVDRGRGFEPASGRVLVRIKEEDHRLVLGQRIEVLGWLSAISPPQSPGEFDYRAYLEREGVSGRISLKTRGSWRELSTPPGWTFAGLRRVMGDEAAASLRLGMPEDETQRALLDALLLGRRAGEMAELSDSFRAVGLSHVLSISGAHLGILLFLVWGIGRLMIGRPSVVTGLVLVVLALFLLAVPLRTPILRAAVMAAVFCAGYGFGRRLTGVQVLSIATLIVLVWKPTELFSAGFQLSFGVVGGILLFSHRLSRRIMPEPEVRVTHPTAWDVLIRWLVDFFAVSVVAFMVAMPIVMYHFQLVSPLAVLLSMLAFPVLTAVLAVGYLKILVGLVSPALGSLLAVPMAWVGDSLSGLVVQAERWPAASYTLDQQPSVGWTLACVVLVVALLCGAFERRRLALIGCVLAVAGWGYWGQQSVSVMDREGRPALVLNMFAVGDGSCFLVRSGGETLMFDCGSQGYWRIGERSIVPALRAMSVDRIDTLMVSHADVDHYVGVLDVMRGVEVGRVLVSPDVLREAELRPDRAAAFLIESIRGLGIEPESIGQGWSAAMGDAQLDILWPALDFVSEENNDNALVLSVRAGGRRVLLTSDIQEDAIGQLLGAGVSLRADVADLAHHGSFVASSPAWLAAIEPSVVLQSSGPRRPDEDHWAAVLEEAGGKRLKTSERGMVELRIAADGRMAWSTHRGE